MKKFILKTILFFVCVVMIDRAFGQIFSYLRAHAKGGSTANCEYIANSATDDIVILGSSRATHHYVPKIIEDSLGLSCYNCGEEGNGVILAYGRLKMLTERYSPKLVIYELTPEYDYGTKDPNAKYLGYLRAYYNKIGIKEIFDDFDDGLSQIKMKSKMYQNTSRLLPDLLDNIIYRDNMQGFNPLYGQTKIAAKDTHLENKTIDVDSMKLNYLEKIIKLCQNKNIPLVFMISPLYNNINMNEYAPAMYLCEKYGIKVFDNHKMEGIASESEYFQDESHMNYKGAKLYNEQVVKQIKTIIL